MRTYTPDYVLCGISKFRYIELKAFCQQYAEKKAEAETLLCVGSPVISGMPHGSGTGDPVARAAERREKLIADCNLIEQCAGAVDNGRFYKAIIKNVCLGTAYKYLYDVLPTNNRTAFYDARRSFYIKIDHELQERYISNKKAS